MEGASYLFYGSRRWRSFFFGYIRWGVEEVDLVVGYRKTFSWRDGKLVRKNGER